jgi:hypothetical protein
LLEMDREIKGIGGIGGIGALGVCGGAVGRRESLHRIGTLPYIPRSTYLRSTESVLGRWRRGEEGKGIAVFFSTASKLQHAQ